MGSPSSSRRPIRRFIVRASAFVLLGAIVNVAVAWGCTHFALFQPPRVLKPPAYWLTRSRLHDAEPIQDYGRVHSFGVDEWFGSNAQFVTTVGIRIAGWPMSSLQGGIWNKSKLVGNRLTPLEFNLDGVWVLQNASQRNSDWLPCRPIWPGFAINTLFFAAILWMLFAGPFALRRMRRRRRIKRGLCPACAYPVGDSAVCTECGNAIEPRSVDPVRP